MSWGLREVLGIPGGSGRSPGWSWGSLGWGGGSGVPPEGSEGCSPPRQVGNRLGVRRGPDDTMHILVDGEDMGPAATGVAKVTPP